MKPPPLGATGGRCRIGRWTRYYYFRATPAATDPRFAEIRKSVADGWRQVEVRRMLARVFDWRNTAGEGPRLSPEDYGAALGLPYALVERVRRGSVPDDAEALDLLLALHRTFGVNCDVLIYADPPRGGDYTSPLN